MKNNQFCQRDAELRKGFIFFSLYCAGETEIFQMKQKAVLLGVLCRKHFVFDQLPALGGSGETGLYRELSV